MTTAQLKEWLRVAKPGSTVVYHTGYLPKDRAHIVNFASTTLTFNNPVHSLARLAMEMSDEGVGFLTQRKLDWGVYEYRITKRNARG